MGVRFIEKMGAARSVSVAARRDINLSAALIRSCRVCGDKGHSAEVCADVVTVLACENTNRSNDESDAAISDEEEEAFVCEMSDECNDESNDEGSCSALAWRVGDFTVICDSGA